jgi:hypothetical protein
MDKEWEEAKEVFSLVSSFVQVVADDTVFWESLTKIIKNAKKI